MPDPDRVELVTRPLKLSAWYEAKEMPDILKAGGNSPCLQAWGGVNESVVLVGPDVGCADHFGPLLGFVGEELAEPGWCERKRGAA